MVGTQLPHVLGIRLSLLSGMLNVRKTAELPYLGNIGAAGRLFGFLKPPCCGELLASIRGNQEAGMKLAMSRCKQLICGVGDLPREKQC